MALPTLNVRAVELAVNQLLSLGRGRDATTAGATYRIDDLARASNVTVRNIRAYQERGLLHPPRREGRVAIFDDSHLSRLKIITSMLERGYTSVHILEMLTAWEGGLDIADVLGLERALVPARIADPPATMTLAEVRALTGDKESLQQYVDIGLIEIKGAKALVKRPELIRAFAEMRGFGVSTDALIRVHSEVSMLLDDISKALVNEAVRQVGHRFTPGSEPSSEQVGELVATLTRFRELATSAVMGTFAESMERTIEDLLTAYLAMAVPSKAPTQGMMGR